MSDDGFGGERYRIQLLSRRVETVTLGYVPTAGRKVYALGRMFLVVKVEELGGGRVRALVEEDAGFTERFPGSSLDVPCANPARGTEE